MKTVGHCATPFLPITGSWLYSQLTGLRRYRSLVLTQELRNANEFPVGQLVTAEDFGPVRTLINRVVRKVTGEYPFYAGILRSEGVDVIHAHHGHQGRRCLRARDVSGLPMATSFYGADATQQARQREWQVGYQRLFDRGELFIVEGTAMAEQLLRLGCQADKLLVNHLGIELDRIPFRERTAGESARILICASFREKKGIPDGIRALARALERTGKAAELTLVGDGPERPQVEAALVETGLLSSTRLLGYTPHSEVIAELSACHLLLQPSRTASDGDSEGGAPVILLEAQAAGVPVVATRHADIPEYVADGVSGLLADEGDVEGLAQRLEQLLGEPEIWPAMGRAGRHHVQEKYNAVTQTSALEAIYDTLT